MKINDNLRKRDMTILDQIAAKTRERIAHRKTIVSLEVLRMQAEALDTDYTFPFEQA